MSSILRGSKKLIVGLGLAGCAGAAAFVFGLSDEGRVARAASYFDDNLNPFSGGPYGNRQPSKGVKWDFNWDKREPDGLIKPLKGRFSQKSEVHDENKYNEKLEKAKSIATRHLILVRHGQYNLDGKTDEERALTELGREQARCAGVRLRELGLPYNRIIQSTMTRATETAQIISKELPGVSVSSCNFLREGAPIAPEPPSANWRPEPQFHQDGARIEAAFRRYFHRAEPSQKEDSYEVLVCHANVIRYFICRAMQFPAEGWLRFSLHNCSLTWLAIRPSGRVTVYTVGDIGHVAPKKMTTT